MHESRARVACTSRVHESQQQVARVDVARELWSELSEKFVHESQQQVARVDVARELWSELSEKFVLRAAVQRQLQRRQQLGDLFTQLHDSLVTLAARRRRQLLDSAPTPAGSSETSITADYHTGDYYYYTGLLSYRGYLKP